MSPDFREFDKRLTWFNQNRGLAAYKTGGFNGIAGNPEVWRGRRFMSRFGASLGFVTIEPRLAPKRLTLES